LIQSEYRIYSKAAILFFVTSKKGHSIWGPLKWRGHWNGGGHSNGGGHLIQFYINQKLYLIGRIKSDRPLKRYTSISVKNNDFLQLSTYNILMGDQTW